MLINETVLREQIWSGPEPFGNCSVRTEPKTLFVSLGGGWALREETKKASRFDGKKNSLPRKQSSILAIHQEGKWTQRQYRGMK